MKELIRNLLEFIRFKICIFVSAIGMSGFLIFNPLDMRLILVALTSFFGSAGAYSFNNIKDVKEDLINRKKINSFTLSVKGLIIVFVCLSIGFVSSLFLSLQSIFFYLFGSATSITYSFFKIKKYFLIKNLYTGFSATLMFLIGANNISIEVLRHYFLISFFVFTVSIISDLRDYKGDKINSIKTLPVLLGYNKTRKIVSILLCMFLFLIINSHFIILLPFSLIIVFFVYKNKTRIAHSIGGFALIFLTIFLIIGDV